MKRGLAGLITVLLFSAFVALGAVPTSVDLATSGNTSTAKTAGSLDADPVVGHDHSAHSHGPTPGSASVRSTATTAGAAIPTQGDAANGVLVDNERIKVLAAGAGPCGPGYATLLVKSGGVGCSHAPYDTFGDLVQASASAAMQAPACIGDGVSGQRVRLIYAYAEGQADRSGEAHSRIVNEVAPAMEGFMRTQSAAAGREMGYRFYMPGCELKVTTIAVAGEAAAPRSSLEQWDAVRSGLIKAGIDASDSATKYMVWSDLPAIGAAGVSVGFAPGFVPSPDQAPIVGFNDDSPTPLNKYNGVNPLAHDMFANNIALVFQGKWGLGASGAEIETHELLHTMGAVQPSAPNYNRKAGGGHCADGQDVMCSTTNYATVVRCHGAVVIDCNGDDYFNPRPAPGSYLSTHWNVANSWFLTGRPDLPL